MISGGNSLSIRLLDNLFEAEGDGAYLIVFKARIDRKGEGPGKDLLSCHEAVEAKVAMEGVKDRALCLYARSVQLTYDLI
jgi:hypothetical protein